MVHEFAEDVFSYHDKNTDQICYVSPFYCHFVKHVRNGCFHTDKVSTFAKARKLSQECSYWMC